MKRFTIINLCYLKPQPMRAAYQWITTLMVQYNASDLFGFAKTSCGFVAFMGQTQQSFEDFGFEGRISVVLHLLGLTMYTSFNIIYSPYYFRVLPERCPRPEIRDRISSNENMPSPFSSSCSRICSLSSSFFGSRESPWKMDPEI